MKHYALLAALLAGASLASPAAAQMKPLSDPVVAAPNPDALFTNKDPKLNRNKQAAYHIMKELLQCNEWTRSGEWLTDKYIQHNPFAKSGLKGVMDYFINVVKRKPTPTCDKLTSPVVAVQAEGDYVTVVTAREYPLPGYPGQTYTSTWFDTWRFVDGKADEHWDPATLPPVAPKTAPAGAAN
jgi:predicted SnoaL-like aldol condensation-catalyzing enzyme